MLAPRDGVVSLVGGDVSSPRRFVGFGGPGNGLAELLGQPPDGVGFFGDAIDA
jgi:hypothetical protein